MDKLRKIINNIEQTASELVFIGDYVNKGKNSKRVVDYLLELKKNIKCVFLMGNHEYVWNSFLLGGTKYNEFLIKFGGIECLESYLGRNVSLNEALSILGKQEFVNNLFPDMHKEFFRTALPYYELDKLVCVHAGLNPKYKNEPLAKHNIEDMVFVREKFIYSEFLFMGKRIIFGHTAFNRPYIDSYKIGIDTGAVYGEKNKLTALNVDGMTFIDHEGTTSTAEEYNDAEILFCNK